MQGEDENKMKLNLSTSTSVLPSVPRGISGSNSILLKTYAQAALFSRKMLNGMRHPETPQQKGKDFLKRKKELVIEGERSQS